MRLAIRLTLLLFAVLLLGYVGWTYGTLKRTVPTHDELLTKMRDADRIVVRLGASGRDESRYFTPVFEIGGREATQELLREVRWVGASPACACMGNYVIEFYQGDKLLAAFGYHHGKNLRWKERWSDLELTAESRAAIPEWFALRGFLGLREVVADEPGWQQRN